LVAPGGLARSSFIFHAPDGVDMPANEPGIHPRPETESAAFAAVLACPQLIPAIIVGNQGLVFINKVNNQFIHKIWFTNFNCHHNHPFDILDDT
jgi:hypothetical protein